MTAEPSPDAFVLPPVPSPTLSFSDRCLGDHGVRALVAALSVRRDVTSIDLRGCHVHAAGALALAELLLGPGGSRIGSLSLEWNALGTSDAGPRAIARALAANCALTTLDLRNNRMGSSGVASLAEALAYNSTLITFDLRWNSAGVSGGLALESALAQNRTLLRLLLQGNRVPDDLLKRIERLLGRNGAASSLVAGAPAPYSEDSSDRWPAIISSHALPGERLLVAPAARVGALSDRACSAIASTADVAVDASQSSLSPPHGLLRAASVPPVPPSTSTQVHLHLHAEAKENEAGQLIALPPVSAAAGLALLPPAGGTVAAAEGASAASRSLSASLATAGGYVADSRSSLPPGGYVADPRSSLPPPPGYSADDPCASVPYAAEPSACLPPGYAAYSMPYAADASTSLPPGYAPPSSQMGSVSASMPTSWMASPVPTPLRAAVRTRTLENALVLQHAEFSNKLKHAFERADAAEEILTSERSRADQQREKALVAATEEAEARKKLALLQRELTEARKKADEEVARVLKEGSTREQRTALAEAARDHLERELQARDARLECT
jgi:hypothetical protein